MAFSLHALMFSVLWHNDNIVLSGLAMCCVFSSKTIWERVKVHSIFAHDFDTIKFLLENYQKRRRKPEIKISKKKKKLKTQYREKLKNHHAGSIKRLISVLSPVISSLKYKTHMKKKTIKNELNNEAEINIDFHRVNNNSERQK